MYKDSPDKRSLVVALRAVFSPLIKSTSKLPAPLAYGSAIIIAILVTVLLGAIIPENLIWLIGLVVLACLLAFVFQDWHARHPPVNRESKSPASSGESATITVFVIVHRKGNKTEYIPDAEVRLSLPIPQIQHTDAHGTAVFDSILNKYVGQTFPVNVTKEGYKSRSPQPYTIAQDQSVYLHLEPLSVTCEFPLEGNYDEELEHVLKMLCADKQSQKQLVTRADIFCSLVRSRINMVVDSTIRTRVIAMLDDFNQRLNAEPFAGKFDVTDTVKDLLSKARIRAKEVGKDKLGVIQLMEVLLEDSGENITKGLAKHSFTPADILSEMKHRSLPDLFSDATPTGHQS